MNAKALVAMALVILSIFPFSFSYFASAYPDGAIIIATDGSVKGTDLISYTGNIYRLTGNITISGYKYAGIQILKSNIVLDGAGFSLVGTNGSWGRGVDLSNQKGVTVKNIEINGFGQGIFLDNSSNNIISNNRIIGAAITDLAIPTGIWLSQANNNQILSNYISSNKDYGILVQAASSNNLLDSNTLTQNGIGIDIDFCPNNTMRNNHMINNNQSFTLAYNTHEQFTQDIDSSNTIDGKPVYYWVGEQGKVVPSDAGYLALGDCSDITVEGLQISHGSITICNTVNSTVKNNNLQNCDIGINVRFCDSIKITENLLINSSVYGISIGYSSNIDVSKNKLDSCAEGISTSRSPVSQTITITNNELIKNSCGIHLVYGQKSLIYQNVFSENGLGINFVSCSYNNITENTFQSNIGPSLRLSGFFNNTLYHNNFIYNSKESLNPWITSTPGAGPNVWDNGFEGNYWNDMQTRYPNATQTAGDKVWDTFYTINDANIDLYPLVEPYQSQHQSSAGESWVSQLLIPIIAAVILAFIIFSIVLYRKHRKTANQRK